jgi:SAM-dependent methyltransferase
MSATAWASARAERKIRANGLTPRLLEDGVLLLCPSCGGDINAALPWNGAETLTLNFSCADCGFQIRRERGIWHALPPDRQNHYARFMREYETVRAAEGRGGEEPSFYLALPHQDLTGRHAYQWQIRARSFRYVERAILPALGNKHDRPLTILDLGAGNGWLSYRLSLRGHRCVAVDLLTNEFDGLAAAWHYSAALSRPLLCFRAEVERLPFAKAQADCVIFNASFHYSEDYSRTLGEAVRCLRPGGAILIVDSPWYSSEKAGAAMVQERRKQFTQQFGFPSDGLASQEFLTDERLAALAEQFGLRWTVHRPWYGMRWAMRPWVGKWKRRREPASFRIYVAVRAQ